MFSLLRFKVFLLVVLLSGVAYGITLHGVSATNIIAGYASDGGSTASFPSGENIFVYLDTAESTDYAHFGYIFHHHVSNDSNVKVVVYLDDGDDVPDSGDTLVFASGAINSLTDGGANDWCTKALASGSGEFTAGSDYWVGFIDDGSDPRWNYGYLSGGTGRYRTCTGCYNSVPSNLSGSWSNSSRTLEVYVR